MNLVLKCIDALTRGIYSFFVVAVSKLSFDSFIQFIFGMSSVVSLILAVGISLRQKDEIEKKRIKKLLTKERQRIDRIKALPRINRTMSPEDALFELESILKPPLSVAVLSQEKHDLAKDYIQLSLKATMIKNAFLQQRSETKDNSVLSINDFDIQNALDKLIRRCLETASDYEHEINVYEENNL